MLGWLLYKKAWLADKKGGAYHEFHKLRAAAKRADIELNGVFIERLTLEGGSVKYDKKKEQVV